LTEARYPGLWSGITLKYEGKSGGLVKSTYEISPGADPNSIKLSSNAPIEIDANGLLHYRFETGEMIESKPVAWQEIDGQRVAIGVDYQRHGDKELGFLVGDYRRNLPLIIDPGALLEHLLRRNRGRIGLWESPWTEAATYTLREGAKPRGERLSELTQPARMPSWLSSTRPGTSSGVPSWAAAEPNAALK